MRYDILREVIFLNITSDMIYGYTDGIILRCLMDGDSYGYDLNSSVSKKSDHQYERKEATLYTTVRRLEKQGYATSYWGEESAGARRRYYSITDRGGRIHERRRETPPLSGPGLFRNPVQPCI